MRLKLIIGASLLAAVLGAGSCIAVLLAFFSAVKLVSPSLLVLSTFLIPLATIVFASIFVYRHTSRRRKLQAFMTLVLSTILTITFFVAASIITSRTSKEAQPPSSPIAS